MAQPVHKFIYLSHMTYQEHLLRYQVGIAMGTGTCCYQPDNALQDSVVTLVTQNLAISQAYVSAALAMNLPSRFAVTVTSILIRQFLFAPSDMIMESTLALTLTTGEIPRSFDNIGCKRHVTSSL
jgi:hypothetical protein